MKNSILICNSKVLTLCILTWLMTGCLSVRLADDVNILGLAVPDHGVAVSQTGIIRSKACAISVFGYGTNPDITALFQGIENNYPKLKYLTRVKIELKSYQYVAVQRDCWELRGIGYQ